MSNKILEKNFQVGKEANCTPALLILIVIRGTNTFELTIDFMNSNKISA